MGVEQAIWQHPFSLTSGYSHGHRPFLGPALLPWVLTSSSGGETRVSIVAIP